jgi:hypothetical protein
VRAEHEDSTAPPSDELPGRFELRATELRALDVCEDERVVLEEVLWLLRVTGCQCRAARARRLHVERVHTLFVAPLAHDGIDLEPGVGRKRALQEAVLEARRPFDEQHATRALRRLHEHAARVVLRHELPCGGRHVHGVDRRRAARRRHAKRRAHRHALGGGRLLARFDRPAVLQKPDDHRRRAVAVADDRGGDFHARVVQHRFRGGDAEHLAIAAGGAAADREGKDRRAVRGNSLGGATRISTVRHEDDAGDRAAVQPLACRGEGAGEVAAARARREAVG